MKRTSDVSQLCVTVTGRTMDAAEAEREDSHIVAIRPEGAKAPVFWLPGGGGLKIEVGHPAVAMPASIEITSAGIVIKVAAAKIELGPAGVAINGDALKVLP